MALPGVNIKLGNGNLGKVKVSSDAVSAMVLTGAEVAEKLVLNKHYLLFSQSDLVSLGVTSENNFLVDKEVRAFYNQTGEGAELHLLVVSQATTLTVICASDSESPLSKLISSASGRVRLAGVNKIAPEDYQENNDQGIDGDCITAATAAHTCAENFAKSMQPFRMFLPACQWDGSTDRLYKPNESSYNRVGFVLASDDNVNHTASIGQVLGRAASIQVHQSIGRVKSGAIATDGWLTDGSKYTDKAPLAEILNDAGYIFYLKYPTKNGCYLNGDPMASSASDDYSELNLGRVIDKAMTVVYDAYISEIQDNVLIDKDGKLSTGTSTYFTTLIDSAIANRMGTQISDFVSYIDPDQDVLATKSIEISGKITPQGILSTINFALSLTNPNFDK